jgi:hypothetical protein
MGQSTKEREVIVEKHAISQPVEDPSTTIQPIDIQHTTLYQPTVVSEFAIVPQPAIAAQPDLISAAAISQPTIIIQPAFDIQRAAVSQHAAVVRPPFVQRTRPKSQLASPSAFMKWMEDSKLTKSRTI